MALPYGVEGFVPNRHLAKADGSNANQDETLDFVVIEFSKESKKIILSHTRTFQEKSATDKARKVTKDKQAHGSTRKSVQKIQDNLEKTTLGDLDGLAKLKAEMEQAEKEEKTAPKAKAAAKPKKEEAPKKEEPKEDKPEDAKAEADKKPAAKAKAKKEEKAEEPSAPVEATADEKAEKPKEEKKEDKV